jgi:putative transposase
LPAVSSCATTGDRSTARPLPGLDRLAGITDDAAFLGEPETNGCAERWIRTLKEQCLWAELHDTIDQLRQAVAGFVDRYNSSWLIQRHGHRTPKQAYQATQSASAA